MLLQEESLIRADGVLSQERILAENGVVSLVEK
jgi:hypothetical protein